MNAHLYQDENYKDINCKYTVIILTISAALNF